MISFSVNSGLLKFIEQLAFIMVVLELALILAMLVLRNSAKQIHISCPFLQELKTIL